MIQEVSPGDGEERSSLWRGVGVRLGLPYCWQFLKEAMWHAGPASICRDAGCLAATVAGNATERQFSKAARLRCGAMAMFCRRSPWDQMCRQSKLPNCRKWVIAGNAAMKEAYACHRHPAPSPGRCTRTRRLPGAGADLDLRACAAGWRGSRRQGWQSGNAHCRKIRFASNAAMQSLGNTAVRQCGSVARRRFVWCRPPCDGICWQLGNADCRKLAVASNAAIEGGLCIPSPYSARKAAPGNPP